MLTAEILEFRALAREFAETELRPHTERWDHERTMDPAAIQKMAELGFMGLRVPEEFGGLGLDVTSLVVVLTEISWGEPAAGLLVNVHNGAVVELLVRHGNDEQKRRLLPALASGELVGAFALSEPDAGSDARSLATEAEQTSDGWRIRGEKRWVTHGASAGVVVVFARTSSGVSAFAIPRSTQGYTVTRAERTMGLRASETVSVALDLTVGPEALLGEEGAGLQYAKEAISLGRLGVAAQATGIARAALEHGVAYAAEREQFGRAIAEFGAIQEKLAQMACRVEAAQSVLLEVAARFDATAGRDTASVLGLTAATAAAKIIASEAAMVVTDEAVQIFGGYGYMRDYPVEKLMRDAKGTEIYEGTNQILSTLVAKDLLSQHRHSS